MCVFFHKYTFHQVYVFRWEQVDERLFPLVKLKDANEKKAKDDAALALTFDDFVKMQQEVKAEFISDSSESGELRFSYCIDVLSFVPFQLN